MDNLDFEKYQFFTEKTISDLSNQIVELEKNLNMAFSIVDISNYINKFIKVPNFVSIINDMLIGIFGAKYTNIYTNICTNNNKLIISACEAITFDEEINLIRKYDKKEFIINTHENLFLNNKENIHSCIGIPIVFNEEQLGFILMCHEEYGFFSKNRSLFLALLANQIGIALENNRLYIEIENCAIKDGLTGLFNKTYFFNTLENHIDDNYSIVMCDIDNFKNINDSYGHLFGDKVLKEVAKIIKNNTSPENIVARYGGEEIIIYIKDHVDTKIIFDKIESIRDKIEKMSIETGDKFVSVTLSFGIYCKLNNGLSLTDTIQKADDCLYESKKTGKNKITICCNKNSC